MNLISSLINNNYRVVERDPDALSSLYRESSSNYKRKNDISAINDQENNKQVEVNALGPGESVVNINVSNISEGSNNPNEENKLNDPSLLLDTDLNSADYILSYRVIECGVVYREIDARQEGLAIPDFSELDNVERLARTRLHCRLTNAKTSEIIAAGLKKISYSYYHHTLPLQSLEAYKDEKKINTNKKKETGREKVKKFSIGVMTTIFSVLGLLVIAS